MLPTQQNSTDKRSWFERHPGWRAFLFVLAAFGCWFLFTALTKIVLTCAYTLFACTPEELKTPPTFHWRSVTLLLVALGAALWVSARIFYTEDDMPTQDGMR